MAASTRHPFCLGLYFVTSQTLSPTVESFAPRVWLSFWLVPANRIYWKSWFPGFTPGPQKVCVLTGGRETCGTEPSPPHVSQERLTRPVDSQPPPDYAGELTQDEQRAIPTNVLDTQAVHACRCVSVGVVFLV